MNTWQQPSWHDNSMWAFGARTQNEYTKPGKEKRSKKKQERPPHMVSLSQLQPPPPLVGYDGGEYDEVSKHSI